MTDAILLQGQTKKQPPEGTGVFKNQSNIYDELILRKKLTPKSSIIDARLGSKCASGTFGESLTFEFTL